MSRAQQRMISQIEKVASEETFRRTVDSSKRPSDKSFLVVDSSKPIESYIDEVLRYIDA